MSVRTYDNVGVCCLPDGPDVVRHLHAEILDRCCG